MTWCLKQNHIKAGGYDYFYTRMVQGNSGIHNKPTNFRLLDKSICSIGKSQEIGNSKTIKNHGKHQSI